MDVVEFRDRGVSRLQHLDIRLRGDRLERVGVDAVEECVHRLPPRPEAVAVRARAPRAAGDRPLEGVRMQIRHPRNERTGHTLGSLAFRLDVNPLDRSVDGDVDHDVAQPSTRRQRVGRKELHWQSMPTTSATASAASGRTTIRCGLRTG